MLISEYLWNNGIQKQISIENTNEVTRVTNDSLVLVNFQIFQQM